MNSFPVIASTLLTCYVLASPFSDEIMKHENWNLLPLTECGIKKYPNRIIKGISAFPGQFPWIAQLSVTKKVDTFICGGALINKRYVVTAAHCVKGNEKRIKRIRLGDNAVIGRLAYTPKTYRVENITIHPEYTNEGYLNDIALIRLDEDVEYNFSTRPICLPINDIMDETFVGEKVDIAGWGKDSSEEYPTVMRYVTLPIRDRCVCNDVYERQLHQGQICAGVMNGGDTCDGDSGGPMVWSQKDAIINKNYLIGIVSYGKEDCGEGPAIYTNVIYYMKWILDNIYDEYVSSETEPNKINEEEW